MKVEKKFVKVYQKMLFIHKEFGNLYRIVYLLEVDDEILKGEVFFDD